jgi:hypothetical protein
LRDSLSGDLNGAERYFRDALARALVKIHFNADRRKTESPYSNAC